MVCLGSRRIEPLLGGPVIDPHRGAVARPAGGIGFAGSPEENLIARAEAVRPTSIKEQMAQAAREAGKENAARTAPAKKKEVRDDR